MTVLPDTSSTRVPAPASDLIDALLPVARIFPSLTATASVTVDRSSSVRTFPLMRTRSGALRSAGWAAAAAAPASHMPAPKTASVVNLQTIASSPSCSIDEHLFYFFQRNVNPGAV